jgi:hypothetical protein
MHGPMNVKSPNNICIRQMEFNSAFKGLMYLALESKERRDNIYVLSTPLEILLIMASTPNRLLLQFVSYSLSRIIWLMILLLFNSFARNSVKCKVRIIKPFITHLYSDVPLGNLTPEVTLAVQLPGTLLCAQYCSDGTTSPCV